jgi:hypothetical protein
MREEYTSRTCWPSRSYTKIKIKCGLEMPSDRLIQDPAESEIKYKTKEYGRKGRYKEPKMRK